MSQTLLLMQKTYKNEDGRDIPASRIDCLAPYEPLADSFFNWQCGRCKHVYKMARAYPTPNGVAILCDIQDCKALNLLVATDTDNTSEARRLFYSQQERERELLALTNAEARYRDLVALTSRNLAGEWAGEIAQLIQDFVTQKLQENLRPRPTSPFTDGSMPPTWGLKPSERAILNRKAQAPTAESTAYCSCGHSRGAHTTGTGCEETGCKCLEFAEESYF